MSRATGIFTCATVAAPSAWKTPGIVWPGYPAAVGIDDGLAILLGESPTLRLRQDIEHGLRRAAQPDAERRHDDRPVDQNRVGHHGIKELRIRQRWILETEGVVRRALAAQQVAHADVHAADEIGELLPARRGF
jgi:hypothetical protein